jgi:hypothetical protein
MAQPLPHNGVIIGEQNSEWSLPPSPSFTMAVFSNWRMAGETVAEQEWAAA